MENDELKIEVKKGKKVLTKQEKIGIAFMGGISIILLGYIGYILTKDSIDFKSKLNGLFGNEATIIQAPAVPVQNLNPNEVAQMNSIKAQQEAEIKKIKESMQNQKNNYSNSNLLSDINNSSMNPNNPAILNNKTSSVQPNVPVPNSPTINVNSNVRNDSVINQPIIKYKKCKCISKKKQTKRKKKGSSIPKEFIYPLYF